MRLWTSSRRPSTLSSAATSSITDAPQTPEALFYRAVCNIWRKWLSRRTRGKAMTWAGTHSSFVTIPCCDRGSRILGNVRGIVSGNPLRGNPHGGVCEGRGRLVLPW